jgi:hypothetical protein
MVLSEAGGEHSINSGRHWLILKKKSGQIKGVIAGSVNYGKYIKMYVYTDVLLVVSVLSTQHCSSRNTIRRNRETYKERLLRSHTAILASRWPACSLH